MLTVQDVNHAINRHGEYSGDKCPIECSDFLLIPLIVNNYDKISKGHISKSTNLQCIVYEKKIGDKYFYIEEIRTGRKKVALKTLYKKKKPVK